MLSKYDQGFLDQYAGKLQKPKWKFILTYGLTWAVVTMVPLLLLEYFVFEKGSFSFKRLMISIVLWSIGGIIFGWWMRWTLLRKYRSIKKKLKETGS